MLLQLAYPLRTPDLRKTVDALTPAPQRTSQTWAPLLRSQAQAIIAADFFQAATLGGARTYV